VTCTELHICIVILFFVQKSSAEDVFVKDECCERNLQYSLSISAVLFLSVVQSVFPESVDSSLVCCIALLTCWLTL